MKCMTSALVEIIFYWAWLIISVWENEQKLKEKTVNYFALRHHWSIEECTREHSESGKHYARIVCVSLISTLEVARYDCFPLRFSLTFQPPLFCNVTWWCYPIGCQILHVLAILYSSLQWTDLWIKSIVCLCLQDTFVAIQSHNVTWCQEAIRILAFVWLTKSFERQP